MIPHRLPLTGAVGVVILCVMALLLVSSVLMLAASLEPKKDSGICGVVNSMQVKIVALAKQYGHATYPLTAIELCSKPTAGLSEVTR